MSERLLRQFIHEVLGSSSPTSGVKGGGNNLYSTSNVSEPATVKKRGGNVLDDEEQEEEEDLQKEKHAACCLILSDDGKVLAVSRKDDPTAFGMPGGKVDPGETPEQAAARELQEETGLTAANLRQVFVHKEDDGYTTHTFVGKVEGEINTPESGVIRWVSPDVLFAGPFGSYNKRLWAQLGLPTTKR